MSGLSTIVPEVLLLIKESVPKQSGAVKYVTTVNHILVSLKLS